MSEGFEPGRPKDPTGGWSAPSGPPAYPPAADSADPDTGPASDQPAGTAGSSWTPPAPGGGQVPPGFAGAETSGGEAGGGGGGGGSKTWVVALVALLVGLLVGGGVGWAVGGGDDSSSDGAAEWQPFCDRADELVAMDDVELDDDEEAALMAELAGLAPERYRDRLDALTQLGEMEDTDDLGAAFGMFGEVFGQLMWLVGTLQVECGIDPEVEGFDSGFDMSGDWSFDSELDGDWDLDSDEGWSDDPTDDEDDGPMSISAIQDLVEDELPDVYERLGSWSVFNDEIVQIASYSDPIDAEEAMAVCEVVVDHLAEHAPDGTVEVLFEGEALASGPAGGPCTAGGLEDAETGSN